MKQKIRFIINPKSGVHQKNDLPKLIDQTIDKRKFDFDIVHTEYAEHARELTRQAMVEKIDIVCAVGGDGSVHEVGTELIGKTTLLAILPAGSGNGLARHLGIPLDLKEAVRRINFPNSMKMDTVLVNDRSFLNVGGFGFDAIIAKKFSSYESRGFWGYARLISREYFSFNPSNFVIEIDGKRREMELVLCTVANASEFGNGLCISPYSKIDDGLIELCLLKPFPSLSIPAVLYKLFKKKNHQNPYSEIISFKKARIYLKDTLAHFDGEPFVIQEEVNIEVNPKSLNVII
jgi:diacylglycerol kinase (ATP)